MRVCVPARICVHDTNYSIVWRTDGHWLTEPSPRKACKDGRIGYAAAEGDCGLMNGESSLVPEMMGDVGWMKDLVRRNDLAQLNYHLERKKRKISEAEKLFQGNYLLSGGTLAWYKSFGLPYDSTEETSRTWGWRSRSLPLCVLTDHCH